MEMKPSKESLTVVEGIMGRMMQAVNSRMEELAVEYRAELTAAFEKDGAKDVDGMSEGLLSALIALGAVFQAQVARLGREDPKAGMAVVLSAMALSKGIRFRLAGTEEATQAPGRA